MNPNRKTWFKMYAGLLKKTKKPSHFVYLGEEFSGSALILSNHVGTAGPLSFELFLDKPTRFWGAHEMNSSLGSMYKYQSEVFYHEKRGWNLFGARMFCLLASPLTWIFYRGLNLISTYHDMRLAHTLRESWEAISAGMNVVIFPEISDKGYLDVLEGFHGGFALLLEFCQKRGVDVPIFVTYYNKENQAHVVDKPILYSELSKKYPSREEQAAYLCARCNRMGEISRMLGEGYSLPEDLPELSGGACRQTVTQ
jgi:hypothetical protein